MSSPTISDVMRACDELEYIFAPHNIKQCSKCPSQWDQDLPMRFQEKMVNRGCCGNCALSHGYLNRDGYSRGRFYDRVSEKAINEVLKNMFWWDDAYGFFNPIDCKCNLPRPLRSRTCLSYCCMMVRRTMSDKEQDKIDKLVNRISLFKDKNKDWLDQILGALQHATA